MTHIVLSITEYKKLLRAANKNVQTIQNNTINEDRLRSQLEFVKLDLEIANATNRGLMIQKDILDSIPKWIVNIFKPKYDSELLYRFLKDK